MRYVVALLALCVLALPADAHAISRKAAEKRALQVLKLGSGPEVVFGLPKPLKRGTVVGEHNGRTVTNGKLPRSAWLFWHDQQFGAFFRHPGRYALIDHRSGKVIRRARTSLFPFVNGRRPAFLRSHGAYEGTRFRVAASPSVRAASAPAATGLRGPWAHLSAPALTKQDLREDCMITIGDRSEPGLAGSIKAMKAWAGSVGLVEPRKDPTTPRQLKDAVTALVELTPCRDVFIFIAGHGYAAPGSTPRNLPPGVTLPPGAYGPAGVQVKVIKKNNRVVGSSTLTPADLENIMKAFPQADFKIKIESCFSGRFVDALKDVKNLRVIEASSAADEVSYGNLKINPLTGEQVVDDEPNPHKAGEFGKGNAAGLTEWSNSAQELETYGRGLAEGIARAAELAKTHDFAQRLGVTHGQLDYKPPPNAPSKNAIAGATWVHHPSKAETNLCVYVTGAPGATGEVDLAPKPGLDTAPKPFTLDGNGRARVIFKINQSGRYTATATWGGQSAMSSDVEVKYPAAGPAPPAGHAACPSP